MQHRIHNKEHPPIRQSLRRVAAAHREHTREGVQDMLVTTAKEHPLEWESHPKRVQPPVDLMYKTGKTQKVTSSEYAADLKQSLEKAYNKVRTTMGAKQLLQRRLYDRHVHGQPHRVSDHVRLHTTVLRLVAAPWTGPYRVLKRLTDSTYRIQSLSNPHKCAVVHFDRLRSCLTCSNSTFVGLLFLTLSVLHQRMTVLLRLRRRQHPSVQNWRSSSQ